MKLISLIVSLMVGCAFGGEIVRPGSVKMHHMPCECGGEMKACAGIVLTSIPPQYPHKCDKCGRTSRYEKSYPWFDVEDKEPVSVGTFWGGEPGADVGLTNLTNAPEFELDHAIRTVPATVWITNKDVKLAPLVEVFTNGNIVIHSRHDHPGSNYICGDMVTHRFGGIASWTQWEFLTNQPNRLREVTFSGNVNLMSATNSTQWYGAALTNFGVWREDGFVVRCEREHWDESPQQEVTYNQSNLLSYVSFRGTTNIQCMESLCVATNTRMWHWERSRVYNK